MTKKIMADYIDAVQSVMAELEFERTNPEYAEVFTWLRNLRNDIDEMLEDNDER